MNPTINLASLSNNMAVLSLLQLYKAHQHATKLNNHPERTFVGRQNAHYIFPILLGSKIRV
jgi:hypothetical protein